MKQNINYIGSKYSLLDFIYEKINLSVDNLPEKVFCDIFSGTNIVGIFFKDKVKSVISNDIEYYSYILAKNSFNNTYIEYENLIKELNSLPGISGYIFNYYSENGNSNRLYFSEENGKKIDAIRIKIEEWKNDITEEVYYALLTSLIEATDKVANTASIYGAYLKNIKKTARKTLNLKVSNNINIIDEQINYCYNEDSNKLIKNIKGDILYIDPPYNHRQYGSNYHILNTISKYDFSVEPKGIVGLMDYNKSKYCYKDAKNVFKELIENANFKHIFISYSSEGILKEKEITDILSCYGTVIQYNKVYKTFKSDSNRDNKSLNVTEFLFHLLKS